MSQKILFKDIAVGCLLIYKDVQAIKVDAKRLHVTKLGKDGFIEFDYNEEIEMEIVGANDV